MFARVRRTGDGPRPSLGAGLLYVPNNLVQQSGAVVAHWTAIEVSACPGWGFQRVVTLEACALGLAGWLTATERAVTNPRSASRSWWSVGAVARVCLALGAGFGLELEVGATVPLVKRRFITTTPEQTVAETPTISGLVGLGLAREFW